MPLSVLIIIYLTSHNKNKKNESNLIPCYCINNKLIKMGNNEISDCKDFLYCNFLDLEYFVV